MSENIREIALDTLLTLEKEKEFSNRLMKAVLDKYDYLPVRDKAFLKRVVEGSVERQIELDYHLDHFSSVAVRKMKPLIRCLLRMSVYQILYMDAVPDSAICDEACKLAAKRKFVNLKGFVNGILRKISREKTQLPMPDPDKEPVLFLSVTYSMPKWIVEKWIAEYDREVTKTILSGLMDIHPVSLRFQPDSVKEQREQLLKDMEINGVKLNQSKYLDYVYTANNVEGVNNLPGFSEGAFTVQDVSSALSVVMANIKKTDYVMDACAAPGGKTCMAAKFAHKVLSRDVSEDKCAFIEEALERMELTNVCVEPYDATVLDEKQIEKADVLLLDVPCSGLGIMGKKRDIKYHVTEEGLKEIVELQKKIVKTCLSYVKPGGTLLYSTCTINNEENAGMVRWILKEFDFEPYPFSENLPAELVKDREAYHQVLGKKRKNKDMDDYTMQLLPGFMQADGFFFARLKRKEN